MTENKNTLQDLIEALKILRKYGNPTYPCHCEHDMLFVKTDPDNVHIEDIEILEDLGFVISEDDAYSEGFISFRFGSC